MDSESARCPLCGSTAGLACSAHGRLFFHCSRCDLCFVPPHQHPTARQATARYAHHRNTPDNADYTARLSRFIEWLRNVAPDAHRILDYGCGRESLLTRLLRDKTYEVDGHDPLFGLHADASRAYDAIVASESLEHFASPRDELTRMSTLLRPGGVLIATTLFHHGPNSLADWWYARDITHLCFYSAATFSFIASRFGFSIAACDQREQVVLQKHQ